MLEPCTHKFCGRAIWNEKYLFDAGHITSQFTHKSSHIIGVESRGPNQAKGPQQKKLKESTPVELAATFYDVDGIPVEKWTIVEWSKSQPKLREWARSEPSLRKYLD
jgi:hypothetical protein